jgi:hypothetical protein
VNRLIDMPFYRAVATNTYCEKLQFPVNYMQGSVPPRSHTERSDNDRYVNFREIADKARRTAVSPIYGHYRACLHLVIPETVEPGSEQQV